MNLGLRQKFSLLAFLAGGLFAVMSIVGYYTSFLNIQNDTVLAVEAMETGTQDVKEGTDAIAEVGEQFKRIMQRVDNIKHQMEGIGVSMRTVSDGASQIVTAVNSIDEVSRKNSEYTNSISNDTETQSASNEEIAVASQALAQLAIEMQDAINKFKT